MMDDGPRIGGLQALALIVAVVCGYLTFGVGAWGAAPFLVVSMVGLVWLEVYARRRVREDREERERRLREGMGGAARRGYDPFDAG